MPPQPAYERHGSGGRQPHTPRKPQRRINGYKPNMQLSGGTNQNLCNYSDYKLRQTHLNGFQQ